MPRAIGMFGHSYNPDYFINPPAFTYVLHALFFARWGGARRVGDAFARRSGGGRSRSPGWRRARSAPLAVGLLVWAGARLFDRAVGPRRGRAAVRSRSCRSTTPTSRSTTCRRSRRSASRWPARRACCAAGARATTCSRASASGWPARPSTRPGSCAAAARRRRARAPGPRAARCAGSRSPAASRSAAFLVANPYALLDFDAFRRGLHEQSAGARRRRRQARPRRQQRLRYYLATLTWGLGWMPALAALGGAVRARAARPRGRAGARPAAARFPALHRHPGPLLRRWLLPVTRCCACWRRAARSRPRTGSARARGRGRAPAVAPVAGRRCSAPRGSCLVHNDRVLAREDTRQLAREWMVANIPEGAKIVVEPIAPDQWATDVGQPVGATGNGKRWVKLPTSRSQVKQRRHARRGRSRVVKLEDYERTTRPELVDPYARGGLLLGRDRLDPVRPRARRAGAGARRDPLLPRSCGARRSGLPRSVPYEAGAKPARSPSTSPSTATRSATSGPGRRCGSTALPGCERRGSARRRLIGSGAHAPGHRPASYLARADRARRAADAAASARIPWSGPWSSSDGRCSARASTPRSGGRTPSARRWPRATAPTPPARRCTSRWSRAATTAARRRAPTRSSPPASPASSSPPTTRPRTRRAAASGSCATRASRSWSPTASSPPRARLLNQPFRKHARTGRPHVLFKSAMTLDGKVATRTGDSKWISGEALAAARAPLARRARRRGRRDRDRPGRRPAAHRAHRRRRPPAAADRVRLRGPPAAGLPARRAARPRCR